MKVYLIRHGRTLWNREKRFQGQKNSPLLEEGREQARRLGGTLRDKNFEGLYCSPLKRTRETAALLGLGREFRPDPAFMEINLGSLEGRAFGEIDHDIKPVVDQFWLSPHTFDKSLTGGEDFRDIKTRAVNRLEELVAAHRGDLCIVSHGALLKGILNHYLDKPLSDFWEPPMLEPASLTVLRFGRGGFAGIDLLGDTSHY